MILPPTDTRVYPEAEAVRKATGIVGEIIAGRYDGYVCRDGFLVRCIAWNLSLFHPQERGWQVCGDVEYPPSDLTGIYKIWIDRGGRMK